MSNNATTPQPVTKPIGVWFPELGASSASTVLSGYDRPWATDTLCTPPGDPFYEWDVSLLKRLIAAYIVGERAVRLVGPTGTGKTQAVINFHARLNLPLLICPANPGTEAQALIGMPVPTGDGIGFAPGPLTFAAMQGVGVLIDEYNTMPPGEAVGLNAVVEGQPYVIPETGQTITPAPGTRVYATMNPRQAGYHGRHADDLSAADRFVTFSVDYRSEAQEAATVEKYLKQALKQPDAVAAPLAASLARVAQRVRDAHGAPGRDALPITMSSRTLRQWARWCVLARSTAAPGVSPMFEALDTVLLNGQPPEVRAAVEALVTAETGQQRVLGGQP